MKYLGKDTEHVFEVWEEDPLSVAIHPANRRRRLFLPAMLIEDNDGKKQTITIHGSWLTEPKLVKIDDIADQVTPAALADMRRDPCPPPSTE